MDYQRLRKNIFSIKTESDFFDAAMQLYELHLKNNPVYREYHDFIRVSKAKSIDEIPFLPIEFFKSRKILLDNFSAENYFSSSGTTSVNTSKHYIADFSIYNESLLHGFSYFLGQPEKYCFLALLPNYLEQQNSSLIHMIKELMAAGKHPDNGFYLHNFDELIKKLVKLDQEGQPVILFGVTYALLDLIEKENFQLKHTIVFETGGMKGRRKEIIREELHRQLCDGFGVQKIFSEYGMTELFSQAYSLGDGRFHCPPWMKIRIRQVNDPLSAESREKSGGINVIDLANVYSCPFIATQDLGKIYADGSFEVLGRFDNSDVRGCNLMIDS